ncbi:hypothetical protein L596_009744 [Steinernema carpocapsae]|uniref:Uncharacterized protein n=1 Tax=Steinernema carpocapsae TaxID=34508 RepID=A0A4U5PH25_STECR|nr:hypothetical protein L596_009744 [Steinernema carpocapsae]
MRDLEDVSVSQDAAQPGITAAISNVSNPELDTLLNSLISAKRESDSQKAQSQNGHSVIVSHGSEVRNGTPEQENSVCSDDEETKEEEPDNLTLEGLMADLKYLNHQMGRIMEVMKIDPCRCASCERRDGSKCQQKTGKPRQIQAQARHSTASRSTDSSSPVVPQQQQQANVDTGTLLMQIFQNQQNGNGQHQVVSNGAPQVNKMPLPPSQPRTSQAGRRSKYCTPEEKRLVAEYAHMHGASAAARKFNIPPAIASYYYKREIKNIAPKDAAAAGMVDDMTDLLPSHSGDNTDSAPGTPLKKESFKMDFSNPAHTSGSPGFLRGRGRGRPKLIGDELDAELVEHMVNIKNHGHITASQALDFARDFIMQKQPGLLAEQGGHVSLKITWAMKLVSRIAERQKEIDMGLQPGALATLQRQASINEAVMLEQQQMAELLKQMSANAVANAGNGFDLGEGGSGDEDDGEDQLDEEEHVIQAIPVDIPATTG